MHARNAISRPRLATAIRRMTAMLNFLVELRECEARFQEPSDERALNPTIAKIQLDVEKLDITSPNPVPATTTVGVENEERLSVAMADVEMGEPPVLNAEPKNVHFLLARSQTDVHLLNSDA